MKRSTLRQSSLLAMVIAAACSPVLAEDAALTAPSLSLDYFKTAPALTGDWGGLRTQMANKGVTFDISLTQTYQGVVGGGLDKGWQYGGRENVTVNFDTQKMGLWPGGFLNIEGEGQYGEFVGARQTGSILPANVNAMFPEPGTANFDLIAFNYTQFLCPNFGVFLGKLDTIVNGDMNAFAHGKGNEGFLNTNFAFNPIMAVTVPYSTLGAGFIILPTGDPKEFVITGSVIDTQGRPDSCGSDTLFEGGTTYAAEGRYTTHFFNLTGHQLLGGVYSDTLYTSLDNRLANLIIPGLPIQTHSGSYAVYYNFDQYVYQPDPKADKGWGVFGRIGGSDGQANPMHWTFSGGIGGKGVIPGRDEDRVGLGYYYIVASKARTLETLNFGDSEGAELFYEFAITPAIRFTPDIQFLKPSQDNVDCATVLGARLEMKF